MAKIVFPGITITPTNGTEGVSTSKHFVAKIPHIVGTGSNGVASGKIAKPVVTGALSITGSAGSLNGKVWQIREAVDIAGNNAPAATPIACTITDITPTTIYPAPQYTEVQFAQNVTVKASTFYEFEMEDELEYVLYDVPAQSGGNS